MNGTEHPSMPGDVEEAVSKQRPFLIRLAGAIIEAYSPVNLRGALFLAAMVGFMMLLDDWLAFRIAAVIACAIVGACDIGARAATARYEGWPALFHPRRGGHLFFMPIWLIVGGIALMWLVDP